MVSIAIDGIMGGVWGFWLALYLDRFYARQVTAINLCVFVFWARSFRANRLLATALNLILLISFLMLASMLFGHWVESWSVFVACWCGGYAAYSFYLATPKTSQGSRV